VAGLDFWDQPDGAERNNITEDSKDEDNEYISSSSKKQAWVDMDGTPRAQVSLILGADILCYSNDAELVANTIQAALVDGGQAILVSADANLRFGVEHFPEACENAGLEIVTTKLVADQRPNQQSSAESGGDSHGDELLVHDLKQTTGYTTDYTTFMFHITKPISNQKD
jgi:hypothetical protein